MSLGFASIPLSLVRGTDWSQAIVLVNEDDDTPIDLTDAADIVMRVRVDIAATAVLMELSVTNERLVITDAPDGALSVEVAAADTLELPLNRNERAVYVFDAVIVRNDGAIEPGFAGKLTVNPQITRYLTEPS